MKANTHQPLRIGCYEIFAHIYFTCLRQCLLIYSSKKMKAKVHPTFMQFELYVS